jgi:peptide/nickel transport system permease protein
MTTSEQEAIIIRRPLPWWRLLWRDKFAFAAAVWLLILLFCFLFGPALLGDVANKMNLRARNMAPGSLEQGWLMVLGGDALGRSILARLIVATRNTLTITLLSIFLSMIAGGILGMIAGYFGKGLGQVIMRFSDVLQSFPSLVLAVVVLSVLDKAAADYAILNLVVVLTITRIPVYLRVARAEVLEIRERVFVDAATALGGSRYHILRKHVAPIIAPTLLTILTVNFAIVLLAESSLSFLGIGMRPPEITWGLMVAQGKNYLQTAWWLAFFPGLIIMISTLSGNILSNWLRIVGDPEQRWRLEAPRSKDER